MEISQNNKGKGDSKELMNESAISKVFRVKPYIKATKFSANENISEEYLYAYE